MSTSRTYTTTLNPKWLREMKSTSYMQVNFHGEEDLYNKYKKNKDVPMTVRNSVFYESALCTDDPGFLKRALLLCMFTQSQLENQSDD